jgi:hypothetical protein
MMRPAIAVNQTEGTKLVPGRDLAVIACERTSGAGRRVVGVRWAARREFGFPPSGFGVACRADGGAARALGTFVLPDSSSWAAFETDIVARQPLGGPWFPSIARADFEFLLPLVRLVDPRVASADRLAQVPAVADFFGEVHRSDAELVWNLWRQGRPPPLAQLLADATATPLVVEFYARHTIDFLNVLALRFEYAALLGLGTDDAAPDGTLVYEVSARWGYASGQAESDPVPFGRRCAPPAPAWLNVERAPGTVPHPAFALWPAWVPPASLAPLDSSGVPRPASSLVPQVPAAFSALSWADKVAESGLLGYGPVLYRVTRHHHGAPSAGSLTAPALPAGAVFVAIADDELIVRTSTTPHFLDRPGMPWPPLEGWYHYHVQSVDLLGTVSPGAARASLRHYDDLAPMAPRARALTDLSMSLAQGAASAQVPLRIDWDPLDDFNSPDAVEFRVSAAWVPAVAVAVYVSAVADVDALHCDLTVTSLPSPANGLAGARLSVPGSEYPIVSHGAGSQATMRIRKIGARQPTAGVDGFVLTAAAATPRKRVARLARRPAAAATVVTAIVGASIVLSLGQTGAVALPGDARVRVYLHLVRATYDATYDAVADAWSLVRPPDETPARAAWERLVALPNADGLLAGSPAILYPPHELTVDVALPSGYGAGLLSLHVTAADSAAYVASPTLPIADAGLVNPRGNESAAFEVVVSVRTTEPPPAPGVPAWDPNTRLWTTSATVYVEDASYALAWTAASGAVRYEVWRAIDSNVAGATTATPDAALRTLADQDADAFALRSDQVFAPSFVDSIPGRAPTRVLYRIRAIGINGERSDPSGVIGPIYVPDIRQPPPPNLVRAVATVPDEADRTIAVEWTQGADLGDVRFDVWFRPATAASAAFVLAGSVPRNAPAGAGGAFRFLHRDRPPARPFEYRVVAVREALDPIDPAAVARRDIASAPSAARVGTAISSTPLAAPVLLTAVLDVLGNRVTLSWGVRDFYDRIEIRRKAPGRHGYEVVGRVAGDAQTFDEPLPPSGTYAYQLRALGASQQATSALDAQVVVP